jgi:hypothetical protein
MLASSVLQVLLAGEAFTSTLNGAAGSNPQKAY